MIKTEVVIPYEKINNYDVDGAHPSTIIGAVLSRDTVKGRICLTWQLTVFLQLIDITVFSKKW